jgi:hypothetical protein
MHIQIEMYLEASHELMFSRVLLRTAGSKFDGENKLEFYMFAIAISHTATIRLGIYYRSRCSCVGNTHSDYSIVDVAVFVSSSYAEDSTSPCRSSCGHVRSTVLRTTVKIL